jgi:DNA-binding Lrp family transcriptional regulator
MRRDGIIQREVAIVDPAKAGRPIQMVMLIKIERDGPPNTLQLMDQISRHEAITQFYHVTGEPDYVAVLSVRSMEEYEDFVTRVLEADARFATRTMVVIRSMKADFAIPLEEVTPA